MLCENPVFVKNVGGLVSCGHCPPCKYNKRRNWTFRLTMEALTHAKTAWVTLTYSDDYLPRSYMDKRGVCYECRADPEFATLHPVDICLFLKRLRKRLSPRKFRFFICGEYGEDKQRPHYHLCLFGIDEADMPAVTASWTDPNDMSRSMGFARYEGELTTENLQYTCGYTVKKMTSEYDPRLYGRYPEFVRHSVGIGKVATLKMAELFKSQWVVNHVKNVGDIPRVWMHNGRMWPIDRYMRSKILEVLQIEKPVKEKALLKYQEEMSVLQANAARDQKVSRSIPSKGGLLRAQYLKENAQKLKNFNSKMKIYSQKKGSM